MVKKVASIDLSVRQNRFCRSYTSYLNNITIKGASLSKMLSDKLYAISGDHICRRVKDVLDVYVISSLAQIGADDLWQIWKETDRELGDFQAYKDCFEDLKEAYDKMKGVNNKPDFIVVYNRVSNVICELGLQKEFKSPVCGR